MSRPYTERFFNTTAQGVWTTYVVPVGFRAVLRTITFANYTGSAVNALVLVNGFAVWDRVLQAAERSVIAELRAVAYEGESIGGYGDGANFHLTACGYLFADAVGPVETDMYLAAGAPASDED